MAYIVKNVSNWNLQNKCFCQKFLIQNVCMRKLMTLPPRMLGGFRDRGRLDTLKVVFQWPQPLGLASLVLDAERGKTDVVMEPTHIWGPAQCP